MEQGLSGNDSNLEQRIDALETALTNLQQRFADLSAQIQRQDDTVALISDVALYGQLRDALATGRWHEADAQTNAILYASINTSSDEVTPVVVSVTSAKWRSGEVEKWRSGEVEKWRSGEVVFTRRTGPRATAPEFRPR